MLTKIKVFAYIQWKFTKKSTISFSNGGARARRAGPGSAFGSARTIVWHPEGEAVYEVDHQTGSSDKLLRTRWNHVSGKYTTVDNLLSMCLPLGLELKQKWKKYWSAFKFNVCIKFCNIFMFTDKADILFDCFPNIFTTLNHFIVLCY